MGFSLQWFLVRSTGSGHTGFSSCSPWAEVLCSMWGLPESRLETVFCSGRRVLIHCGGGGGGGLVAKSFLTLATPWTVCSLPGSSVRGFLQARILEWVAVSSSSLFTIPPGKSSTFLNKAENFRKFSALINSF